MSGDTWTSGISRRSELLQAGAVDDCWVWPSYGNSFKMLVYDGAIMYRGTVIAILVMLSGLLSGCGISEGLPERVAPISHPTATLKPPPLPVGQKGNWRLIFQDEFEGVGLDPQRWVTCYWWDKQGCTIRTNRELEWYQPENVSVSEGLLRLRAQPGEVEATDGKTYQYTSGMISSGRQTSKTSTPTKFSFTYGYAEIRARVPQGKGLWPAFWLLPDDHTSKPEIDVMEILGDQPHTVELRFHYRGPDDKTVNVGESWSGPDFSAGWHTFAIDWQPDTLIWYVDGVERQRYTDRSAVPAQPMYLILNLAVGGNWPGSPDASTPFPSDYLVDYVRVWVKQ